MSKQESNHKRVLAFDFGTRGFGYAVMEGPHQLIDWGVGQVRRDKTAVTLAKVGHLINRYQPDILVVEDYAGQDKRRPERVRVLAKRVRKTAITAGGKVQTFSRSKVKEAFVGTEAVTKHQIATLLARWFPELTSRLPPKRKPWMPEHPQMGLFDAVSLAMTCFYFER